MLRRTAVVAATVGVLMSGAAAVPAVASTGSTATTATSQQVADPTIIDVTSANYDQVMQMSHNKPVVLDFTADWCYWCQKQKPYLQQFHTEDGGSWIWARVDVDQNPQITRQWGVRGIPALLNIQNAQEAGSRQVGFDGPTSLRRWLNNL